jgi:hypothetical protein
MIAPADVSVVIPTRGNVPMDEIVASLNDAGFVDIIVWDNSKRENHWLYARYAAIEEAKNDVIATHDDDVIVTHWPEILAAYEPGVVTISYPQEWDIPWVATGAVFDKESVKRAFDRYFLMFDDDDDFRKFICDGIFVELCGERNVLGFPYREMPWANDAGRISTEPGWYNDKRGMIRVRCDMIKAAA